MKKNNNFYIVPLFLILTFVSGCGNKESVKTVQKYVEDKYNDKFIFEKDGIEEHGVGWSYNATSICGNLENEKDVYFCASEYRPYKGNDYKYYDSLGISKYVKEKYQEKFNLDINYFTNIDEGLYGCGWIISGTSEIYICITEKNYIDEKTDYEEDPKKCYETYIDEKNEKQYNERECN